MCSLVYGSFVSFFDFWVKEEVEKRSTRNQDKGCDDSNPELNPLGYCGDCGGVRWTLGVYRVKEDDCMLGLHESITRSKMSHR